MKRLTLAFSIVLSMFFVLFASAEPVKIGILSSLSGPAAGTGLAQKAGFELALEEINAAGGVLGEPLQIIIEDDQANAEAAIAAFEKLMTEDEVEFIGGAFQAV
ncbi:MAG: ABC transporter substrate-binding protein [Deinococcales bacterium]